MSTSIVLGSTRRGPRYAPWATNSPLATRRCAEAIVVLFQQLVQRLAEQARFVPLDQAGQLGQPLQLRGGVVAGLGDHPTVGQRQRHLFSSEDLGPVR